MNFDDQTLNKIRYADANYENDNLGFDMIVVSESKI